MTRRKSRRLQQAKKQRRDRGKNLPMVKSGKERPVRKETLHLTEKIFSSATDLSLWVVVYFAHHMLPQSRFGASYRAAQAADSFLRDFNYEVLKRAIANARGRGFIKLKSSSRRPWPEITEAGRKRLDSILPSYDEKRVWDGRMYMVTYDIAEKRRKDRDLLRVYLQRISCGRLQASVWITPYNPRATLREFIIERKLAASVIVSDMGKDSAIGNEDLQTLVARVYNLSKLNEDYKNLLSEVEEREVIDSRLVFKYLSVLDRDPQIPFSLLPTWWVGDEVWKKFRPHLETKKKQNAANKQDKK